MTWFYRPFVILLAPVFAACSWIPTHSAQAIISHPRSTPTPWAAPVQPAALSRAIPSPMPSTTASPVPTAPPITLPAPGLIYLADDASAQPGANAQPEVDTMVDPDMQPAVLGPAADLTIYADRQIAMLNSAGQISWIDLARLKTTPIPGFSLQKEPCGCYPATLISPDRADLIYIHNDDLWDYRIASGDTYPLTTTTDRAEQVTPDLGFGKGFIVFNSTLKSDEGQPSLLETPHTVRPDGREYLPLTVEPGAFALSPDGLTIAYTQDGGMVLFRQATGRTVILPAAYGLTEWPAVAFDAPFWSPAGDRIATRVTLNKNGAFFNELAVLDLKNQSSRLWTPSAAGFSSLERPTWSPDGHMLAFTASDDTSGLHGLWLADLERGVLSLLADYGSSTAAGSWLWSPDSRSIAFVNPDLQSGQSVLLADVTTKTISPTNLPQNVTRLLGWVPPEKP
jgi:hypothetical protein